MANFIWKGIISFGLVEIPVGLRSAENRSDLKFSYLDRRNFAPVGYERINKKTGKPVPWEDVVRGFEHDDGEYVILTEDDFKRANVRATQTIEIVSFVDGKEIDPIYFDSPYYLLPVSKAGKAYALLRDTLERTGQVGIAHFVLRTREHIAALTARENVLLLQLLRFPHEIVKASEFDVPSANGKSVKVSPAEVRMAERLVAGMSAKFDPSKFKDQYREDLKALIRKRVKAGKTEIVEEPIEERPIRGTRVVDLMPLLEKSIREKQKGSRGARPPGPPTRRPAATSRRRTG
ncbi:MAG: Ku protein [Candidatus Eiseniibacteriota bacterium]